MLASTSDVYGNRPDLPFTEDGITVSGPSTVARWAYGVGKLADEHMAWGYNEEYGLDGLRPALLRQLRRAPVPELVGRPAGRRS